MKIKISDIPEYLKNSDFYKEHCEGEDEDEEMPVPFFKEDETITNERDFENMFNVCDFWGKKLPHSFLTYAVNNFYSVLPIIGKYSHTLHMAQVSDIIAIEYAAKLNNNKFWNTNRKINEFFDIFPLEEKYVVCPDCTIEEIIERNKNFLDHYWNFHYEQTKIYNYNINILKNKKNKHNDKITIYSLEEKIFYKKIIETVNLTFEKFEYGKKIFLEFLEKNNIDFGDKKLDEHYYVMLHGTLYDNIEEVLTTKYVLKIDDVLSRELHLGNIY